MQAAQAVADVVSVQGFYQNGIPGIVTALNADLTLERQFRHPADMISIQGGSKFNIAEQAAEGEYKFPLFTIPIAGPVADDAALPAGADPRVELTQIMITSQQPKTSCAVIDPLQRFGKPGAVDTIVALLE